MANSMWEKQEEEDFKKTNVHESKGVTLSVISFAGGF